MGYPAQEPSQRPWYRDGLRFSCTRCGQCCGGAPGYVWVDDLEVAALASRLDLTVDEFRRRYTLRVAGQGTSLTETDDYDCIFYDRQRGCTVYSDRPRQCRTWPFWGKVVAGRGTWDNAARDCPGMNRGRTWDVDTITALASQDGLPE